MVRSVRSKRNSDTTSAEPGSDVFPAIQWNQLCYVLLSNHIQGML